MKMEQVFKFAGVRSLGFDINKTKLILNPEADNLESG